MKNKNNGFTLIEIIIVIAILGILSTGAIVTINRIGYANTRKAAKTIDMAMTKVRLETMTKEEKQYLYLYNKDDVIYMKISPKESYLDANLDKDSGIKITEKNAFFYYETSIGSEKKLENNDHICISFVRSSGAFHSDSDYDYIRIQNSNRIAKIKCIQETGRHWVE